eukprot:TRINITY_DN6802_c0_g2_i1.p1 TRINITY_DN6802_c0_g2~~TRINITY_DN6802_c0_g2_i1.p1  ORF type:complete len:437 (+),score=142.38 TRINITY_DN6802_c0_g2_i1:75-1313(+)
MTDALQTRQTHELQAHSRLSRDAAAKGQVQKAMGQNVAVDSIWEDFCAIPAVQAEFGETLNGLSAGDEKVAAVSTLVPLLRKKITSDADALARKRAGILNGYRDAAEKNGISWRQDVAQYAARGMDVWERERAACMDSDLAIPDYYVYGGQGPLHSYAEGNCNWEAAFDCKPAFELVHMHHFPQLSPADCMAELHRRLDDAAIGALQVGGHPRSVIDVGCGVGTSTFSLRKSLDRHGFQDAKLVACDLSTHFIAVARYRQVEGDYSAEGWSSDHLDFRHGDGLQLGRLGCSPGSADLVMHAKLMHEAPSHVNRMFLKEAVRALRPGGVLAHVDINPVQILKNNPVSNIAQRVAIANEPFFDQFLGFDLIGEMEAAGLEIVTQAASNPVKWPDLEDSPVRIVVARKPAGIAAP